VVHGGLGFDGGRAHLVGLGVLLDDVVADPVEPVATGGGEKPALVGVPLGLDPLGRGPDVVEEDLEVSDGAVVESQGVGVAEQGPGRGGVNVVGGGGGVGGGTVGGDVLRVGAAVVSGGGGHGGAGVSGGGVFAGLGSGRRRGRRRSFACEGLKQGANGVLDEGGSAALACHVGSLLEELVALLLDCLGDGEQKKVQDSS